MASSVAEARACFIDVFLKSVEDLPRGTKCCIIQTDECIRFYPQMLSKDFIKTAGDDQLRLISSVIADSADVSDSKLKVINAHLDINISECDQYTIRKSALVRACTDVFLKNFRVFRGFFQDFQRYGLICYYY